MKCVSCNKRVNRKFKICPYCCEKIEISKNNKNKIIIILSISLLVILIVSTFLISSFMKQKKYKNQSNDLDNTKWQLKITIDKINIRKNASVDSSDIGDVYKNEIYTILEKIEGNSYIWYKIKTQNNIEGYIASNKKDAYVEIISTIETPEENIENKEEENSKDEVDDIQKDNTNNVNNSSNGNNTSNNSNNNNNTAQKDDPRKQNYLTFNDPFFENCLKNSLNITGTNKVSEYDMNNLKKLKITDGVTDITGISYAKNLYEIEIDSNITDGLNELASIKSIKTVSLGFWKKFDISFLKNMENVTKIHYGNPDPTNGSYSDLCANKNLEELFFYEPNNTEGISFLSNCSSIKKIELWHAFLPKDDISVLLNLNNLKSLTLLTYNELSDSQNQVIINLMNKGISYKKM